MIAPDITLPLLDVTSKKHLFYVLAHETAPMLRAAPEALLTALLTREKIGSTGIGNGACIPHVKMEGIDRLYSVLATLRQPVDYDAPDQKPVDIVFMLIAPAESKTTQHLRALAQMSRFLKDTATIEKLRAALNSADLRAVIEADLAP